MELSFLERYQEKKEQEKTEKFVDPEGPIRDERLMLGQGPGRLEFGNAVFKHVRSPDGSQQFKRKNCPVKEIGIQKAADHRQTGVLQELSINSAMMKEPGNQIKKHQAPANDENSLHIHPDQLDQWEEKKKVSPAVCPEFQYPQGQADQDPTQDLRPDAESEFATNQCSAK
jgi:hypothetical protein